MFKLASEPTFTHTVKISVPSDGGHIEQTLKVTFRVLSIEEFKTTGTIDGQQAFLRKAIAGFDDVVGDDDQPVAYSDALRDQLIAVPYARSAILQTYLEALKTAPLGN